MFHAVQQFIAFQRLWYFCWHFKRERLFLYMNLYRVQRGSGDSLLILCNYFFLLAFTFFSSAGYWTNTGPCPTTEPSSPCLRFNHRSYSGVTTLAEVVWMGPLVSKPPSVTEPGAGPGCFRIWLPLGWDINHICTVNQPKNLVYKWVTIFFGD